MMRRLTLPYGSVIRTMTLRITFIELLRKTKVTALKISGTPDQVEQGVQQVFTSEVINHTEKISALLFYADIHLVIDMFACLFEVNVPGLYQYT
jgi:hypothetical protein